MKRLFAVIFTFLLPLGLIAQSVKESGAKDYTTAILWQQHSGEYRALCFQAYNFARLSLNERLTTADGTKPRCVIVDIDETILDNSAFQGHELKKDLSFDVKDWAEWTGKGAADTVPGALGFLKYAAAQKVETFYITNRDKADYKGTMDNLRHFGFPFADEAHLMINTSTSDKEPRRQLVNAKYDVLLLCGDNLSDFANVFYREGKNTTEQVDLAQQLFGTRFIVLPNPMYGDWEKQFYQGGRPDEKEKSRLRAAGLKSY